MQRIIQHRQLNPTSKSITENSTLVIDRNSGIGKVVTTNATTHSKRSRGSYRKHKGGKTPLDFERYRKTLKSSLYNNYDNNDKRVRFVTLTFKDNRIKTIEGAKKKFDEYRKQLEKERKIASVTLCPEYDENHKPHLHAVIKLSDVTKVEKVKESIIDKWLEANWKHGLATSEVVWDIKGLVNYLVPAYDVEDYATVNEELTPDREAMEKATIEHHVAKSDLKKMAPDSPEWVKNYVKKKRAEANREKKKENQKQLRGNERAVYLSRGQAKTARVKTSNKDILNLWKTAGTCAGSMTITTTINTYDDETGELIKSFERKVTVDRYFFTNKQSRLIYDLLIEEAAKNAA